MYLGTANSYPFLSPLGNRTAERYWRKTRTFIFLVTIIIQQNVLELLIFSTHFLESFPTEIQEMYDLLLQTYASCTAASQSTWHWTLKCVAANKDGMTALQSQCALPIAQLEHLGQRIGIRILTYISATFNNVGTADRCILWGSIAASCSQDLGSNLGP
jgi:hypothetical protein